MGVEKEWGESVKFAPYVLLRPKSPPMIPTHDCPVFHVLQVFGSRVRHVSCCKYGLFEP
jgi:hypothetical protein